jgi:hypothetical protein
MKVDLVFSPALQSGTPQPQSEIVLLPLDIAVQPQTEQEIEDNFADEMAALMEQRDDPSEAIEPKSPSLDKTGLNREEKRNAIEKSRYEAGGEMALKLKMAGKHKIAEKLEFCHTVRTHRFCNGCRKSTPFWNRCDIFWCPQCSPRLSTRRLDGLMWFVDLMKQPKHLVLTFRNVPFLSKGYLRRCVKSLQKFRARKLFKSYKAGLWAMEITNEEKGWHVHFHLVVDGSWVQQKQISEVWRKCTDDDSFIVWINDASKGGLKKNLPKYVTKYAGKGFRPHEWDAFKLAEFVEAVDGIRTFGTFGEMFAKRKEWKEWMVLVLSTRKKCECGCSNFKYLSDCELFYRNEIMVTKPRAAPVQTAPTEVQETLLGMVFGHRFPR